MPVPLHSKSIKIADAELVAEAMLNNCSDLWTASVKSGDRLVATGAGSSPEGAMANAIAAAEHKLSARTAGV